MARSLVEAGFTYLKLDFTFAPAADGVFHDPSRTPAERVRAGYDAIRRGAGEDTFLLGLRRAARAVIGVVDGMRIGADVAPHWSPAGRPVRPGRLRATPAGDRNGWRNTLARSFLHRRFWLNDPDCVMLRTLGHRAERRRGRGPGPTPSACPAAWRSCPTTSPCSTATPARLLDEVLAIGRASDAAARAGRAPGAPT